MINAFKKTLLGVMAVSAVAAFSLPASARVMPNVPQTSAVGGYAAPNASKPTTHAGYVGTNGSIDGGSGYTVDHTGTGSYTITYPSKDFPTAYPVMVLSTWGINGAMPIINLYGTSCNSSTCVFNIYITNNSGAAQDNAFDFIVLQSK
jgi:hypothetical protein